MTEPAVLPLRSLPTVLQAPLLLTTPPTYPTHAQHVSNCMPPPVQSCPGKADTCYIMGLLSHGNWMPRGNVQNKYHENRVAFQLLIVDSRFWNCCYGTEDVHCGDDKHFRRSSGRVQCPCILETNTASQGASRNCHLQRSENLAS